jgi:single-strand DNA-binding protein
VEGRLRQDRWEQEGQTRSRVRIAANNIHFLPKRNGEQSNNQDQPGEKAAEAPTPADAIAWDE